MAPTPDAAALESFSPAACAVALASEVSPDGTDAVVVIATNYPDDPDLYQVICGRSDQDGEWREVGGTSRPGWWRTVDIDDPREIGVATYWDDPFTELSVEWNVPPPDVTPPPADAKPW